MPTILVLAEVADGKLRTASLPAFNFARQVAKHHGAEVHALVIGSGVAAGAQEAAKYAAKVHVVDSAALAQPLAETYAPVVAAAAKASGAVVVCGTATSTGKDVLPRAAALLDAGMASDCTEVVDGKTFGRPMYAGNANARVQVLTPIIVASVRQTGFPAADAQAPGAVAAFDAGAIDARGATFVKVESAKSERPDLAEARVVVSGGRGMKEGKNFEIVGQLADLLGGAMGASRAACDAGMVPNDLQVGQTGKVVAPELYIAVAISGAIQHLAGMKNSKVIVCINKDAEAPIFQVADYGLVGTWEQNVPALIEEVKKLKSSQT